MTFRPSFFNSFSFCVLISQIDSYESKKDIMWWFGGNWSINGRDLAIFMLNFSRFWSMGIMAFRPSFFNLFSFFVSISQNNSCEPK